MVNAASAASFVALCAALIALEIFCFLEPQPGAGTAPPAQAPPLLDSALGLLVPLAAAGLLLAAVASIYRRLMNHAVPAADGRRLSGGAVNFILCVAAGVLHFSFSAQPGGGDADHVARARALGLAAHRALPASATATFFWGMMLIIVAHVRAGGEGGGVAGAGAEHGAVQGVVRLLTKLALGAAAGLVFLVAMALGVKY